VFSSKLTLFKKKRENCKTVRRARVFKDLAFTQEKLFGTVGSKIKVFLVTTKIMNGKATKKKKRGVDKDREIDGIAEGCLVRILLKGINKPPLSQVAMTA
jgi:hypothetical protein